MSALKLPDETTLQIFSHLTPSAILTAGRTCSKWHRLSHDNSLWQRLIHKRYPLDDSLGSDHVDCCRLSPTIQVYRSIEEDVPRVSVQRVKLRNKSEVLHVAFSRNGRFVCSASKSGRVCLFEVTSSYRLDYYQEVLWWTEDDGEVSGDFYCFYSEFNDDDSLLLLCTGGIQHAQSCGIYVYDVSNLPTLKLVGSLSLSSDVYASWENESAFLYGEIDGSGKGIRVRVRRAHVSDHGIATSVVHRSVYIMQRSNSIPRKRPLYVWHECDDALEGKLKCDRMLYSSGASSFCPYQIGCCTSASNGAPYSSLQRETIRASDRVATHVYARVSGVRLFSTNQFLKMRMTEMAVGGDYETTSVRSFGEAVGALYHSDRRVEVAIIQLKASWFIVPRTGCVFTFLDVNCKNYLARLVPINCHTSSGLTEPQRPWPLQFRKFNYCISSNSGRGIYF